MTTHSPAETLYHMINGFYTTQVVYAAAKLGIADNLSNESKSVEEIASSIEADNEMLLRLLRGMVMFGLLDQDEGGKFKLTDVGECLRTDVPNSLHEQSLFMSDELYQAWGSILHTVKTGETAFNHVHGMGFFDYCIENAEFGQRFNLLAGKRTRKVTKSITAAYDFSSVTKVVDIAGGNGTLIAEILKANPHLDGMLFDMESVIKDAEVYLRDQQVLARTELVHGSLFESLPKSSGTYILKSILHDWDNARCIDILNNCHKVMDKDSKLLVIERLIPERITRSTHVVDSDLAMMVMAGGQERTVAEFRALLGSTGFHLDRIIETESDRNILECVLV